MNCDAGENAASASSAAAATMASFSFFIGVSCLVIRPCGLPSMMAPAGHGRRGVIDSRNPNRMTCPICKLVSPPSAMRCDCGYAFVADAPLSPRAAATDNPRTPALEQIRVDIRVIRNIAILWTAMSILAGVISGWYIARLHIEAERLIVETEKIIKGLKR